MGHALAMLLLDTHVFIWYERDARLTAHSKEKISQARTVFFSAVSAWEIVVKRSLGKLDFAGSPTDLASRYGFDLLPVTPRHAEAVESLPFHHRDPFDRLLLAQAQVDGLVLVTHDRVFQQYGLPLLLV